MMNWGRSLPAERVQFLTVEEVLAIHEALVDRFGGLGGVRDLGLLESALYRPRTGYYRDLVEMAAALFESLIMNHSFVDGNKRAAFFAADVFLRLNGYKIKVDAAEGHSFLIGLLDRAVCDFKHLEPWIRRLLVSLPQKIAPFPSGQVADLRARKIPHNTSSPPKACPRPSASDSSIQARRAAKTGCSSRVTEEKAAGKWARA